MKKVLPVLFLVLIVAAGFWLLIRGGPYVETEVAVTEITETPDSEHGYRKAPAVTSLLATLYGQMDSASPEPMPDPGEGSAGPEADAGDGIIIPGEYVLRFHTRADQEAFMRVVRELGYEVLGRMSFGNALRIRVPDEDALRRLLGMAPAPRDHDHNYFVRTPDPKRAPQRSAEQGYVGLGDALLAWLGAGVDNANWGRGVTIAVLDTAVSSHPGIPESRIRRLGKSGMTTEGAKGDHGTAIASLIIGDPAHAAGIAPAASVLSIPIITGEGSGNTFALAEAVIDAVSMGSDIINMSLGTYGNSALLKAAIGHALHNQVAVVAATGNDAQNMVTYPARYKGVIGVGAVDANGRPLYFSNHGPQVDVAAPGYGVRAAGRDGAILQTTGTSIATPLVSGAIAAILSEGRNLRPVEAARILVDYSDDRGVPGEDIAVGEGVISVQRALDRDTSGIYNMTAAPAFTIAEGEGVERMTVYLYAQNRGTEPLDTVTLNVDVNGEQQVLTYDNVGVGDSVIHEFVITTNVLAGFDSITITHSVGIPGQTDSVPGDNARETVMTYKGK